MNKILTILGLAALLSCNGNGSEPVPIPPPPVTDDPCDFLIDKSPRGIACLHCLVGKTADNAQTIINIARRSCVSRPAINYLVGGGFGFDVQRMRNHITELTEPAKNGQKRTVHLVFYLSSGPNARRWWQCPNAPDGFGDCMHPDTFRMRIQSDSAFQAEYQALYTRLRETIDFAKSRGAVIRVIPQLEDNQNSSSYGAMWSLIRGLMPQDEQICRNPCPGCFSGNSSDIPAGQCTEKHGATAGAVPSFGIFSNDGVTATFQGELTSYPRSIYIEDLRPAISAASDRNSWFIIWTAKAQGITFNQLPRPDDRNYHDYTADEQETLKQILRH